MLTELDRAEKKVIGYCGVHLKETGERVAFDDFSHEKL